MHFVHKYSSSPHHFQVVSLRGGLRLQAHCDLVVGGGEFLLGNGRGITSKGANGDGVVRWGCVDLVGGVH